MFFINIYLEKLIQRSIAIINAQEFKKITNVTILRIRNNLILKREQKLKLRIIFLQLKKNANNVKINNDLATTIIYCDLINKVF